MSEKERGNLNLGLRMFNGEGLYNIPVVQPCTSYSADKFISFNYAKTTKEKDKLGVHCFLDDYQIARLWEHPNKYIDMLKPFNAVCAPDFSLYIDYPIVVQMFNHYRKMWISAYYQEYGINIVPVACWSDDTSYSFCFDGMPKNSIIAVSTIGTIRGKIQNELFRQGYEEMTKRLNPVEVLLYGLLPDWMDEHSVTMIGTANERFDALHSVPTHNDEEGE